MQLNSSLIDDLKYNLQNTKIDSRFLWINGLYNELRYRTQAEIDFESLKGPTVDFLLNSEEIKEIDKLTKKSNWKFKQKFEVLDSIFKPKGYTRSHCGTNRVVYIPQWDNSFVVKVALDRAAKTNMPNELLNQKYLKPFVCKCFDIDHYDNIGVYERVIPILNLDQFWEIRKEVYDIVQKLIKRFVIDDFGTKVFKNWGVRSGFGPVLLDYADMYLIDPETLYCKSIIDFNDSTSKCCGGRIGYTEGYNSLICLDCGKPAKAAEFKGKPKLAFHVPRKREMNMSMKFINPETKEVMFDSRDSRVKENYIKSHKDDNDTKSINESIIDNLISDTNKTIDRYNAEENKDILNINKRNNIELKFDISPLEHIEKDKIINKEHKCGSITFLSRNESALDEYIKQIKKLKEAHLNTEKNKKDYDYIKIKTVEKDNGDDKKLTVIEKENPINKENEKMELNKKIDSVLDNLDMVDKNTENVIEKTLSNISKNINDTINNKFIALKNIENLKNIIKENIEGFIEENTNGEAFTLDELDKFISYMDKPIQSINERYILVTFIPYVFLLSADKDNEINEKNLKFISITKEQLYEIKPEIDKLYSVINDAKIALEDEMYGDAEDNKFEVIKKQHRNEK